MLNTVSQVSAVFDHDLFVLMLQMDVALVLLDPDLNEWPV
jgi:hypothetical protein